MGALKEGCPFPPLLTHYATHPPTHLSLHTHRKSCNSDKSDVRLSACTHCGATNWNILGDSESGYVLSEGDGKYCLVREKDSKKAKVVNCEKGGYTALQLQFANRDDIKAMSSEGARLITAASDGDKKAVKAFLKNGVDVNSRDWDQLTAVIAAASAGHLDMVKFLLDSGADVNAKDKDDITALMEAAIMGHKVGGREKRETFLPPIHSPTHPPTPPTPKNRTLSPTC